MGGGGSKSNPLGYVGDALIGSSALTAGGGVGLAASTDAGQQAIDDSGLNPDANKTKIEDEGKKANSEQKGREASIAENKSQAADAKKYQAKRNRQRSLMGQSGGRSGTILTGGLGVEGTGVGTGKTLLGS